MNRGSANEACVLIQDGIKLVIGINSHCSDGKGRLLMTLTKEAQLRMDLRVAMSCLRAFLGMMSEPNAVAGRHSSSSTHSAALKKLHFTSHAGVEEGVSLLGSIIKA